MLTQISIYTENKKGVLERITEIFAENRINVDAMIVNDSAEFGTARFIVDQSELAADLLGKQGYIVKKVPVIGVFLSDSYGELHHLLGHIVNANLNIEYIYATFDRESASPIVILKSNEDGEIIENILIKAGYRVK